MNRILALCFLMVAGVMGFLQSDSQPVWAPFAQGQLTQTEPLHESATSQKAHVAEPVLNWLPDTGAASVHAASLIALKDGGVRAFWFAGSREGAPDVVINSAVYDPVAAKWSVPSVVMDRISAERGLARYIAKLGNPVPARMADGRMQLFFVTVSIGGWAGSSISTMISEDEGLTWGKPKRLITSPFINLSTLVKSPALAFADGRLGLPAYHEWIGRFGEFLRLDAEQVIDKRRMSSGRGAIQPTVLVDDAQQASAFFRQTRSSSEVKQIPVSSTSNAGQTWLAGQDLSILNPNSAVASLMLSNGKRLLVLNDIDAGRHRLVLMMSEGKSNDWQVVQVLEDDGALANEERKEFSYPFLMTADGSNVHLVYTWNRKRIRHSYFDASWLAQAWLQLQLAQQEAQKEVQK
ncbi:Predicted neuraminidase (sialidase) [Polynucleobacter meluiroseus]|uniref:Predicted neuraminidase (Sialidase) n=1 Tax=Polynucleobacter meluiroseus TaxID=1938814 RepID=A0A240E1L5_9BURK|nr:sialidase family protein [Polynucleobacter meluiroseus]SNX29329.1 Predicted neuraminidase (sialidase) [Polynucleobacter meluiroseus]